MIFSVDNTTEKIITQLQNAIDGSIRQIHENQAGISKEIHSLKDEMSQEEVLDSLRDVRKDFEDLGDKIGNLERNNDDTISILARLKSSIENVEKNASPDEIQKIKTSVEELALTLLILQENIAKIQEDNASIAKGVDSIETNIEKIQKTETDILEHEESIQAQLKLLSEKDAQNKELLKEIGKTASANKKQLGKIEEDIFSSNNAIRSELTEAITSAGSQTQEIIKYYIDSSDSTMKEALKESISNSDVQLKATIKEQGNITEQQVLSNREEVLKLQESVSTANSKLDQLTSDNGEKQKRDNLESEKIDKIIEYLKKPGIARFFSGLKGE